MLAAVMRKGSFDVFGGVRKSGSEPNRRKSRTTPDARFFGCNISSCVEQTDLPILPPIDVLVGQGRAAAGTSSRLSDPVNGGHMLNHVLARWSESSPWRTSRPL